MNAAPPALADVAIVGAGPAGLAAASELLRLGTTDVVVLEREGAAGGIPRHCGHYPFGMREFYRVLRGPDYARRLVARALDYGVKIFPNTTVSALHAGARMSLATPHGPRHIKARTVLLATGVRESSRAARLIGGAKPGGVLPTGALQGIVYLNGQKPFERPIIVGSELVAFSALMTCRHAGIRPRAIIEAGPRATAQWPAHLLARLMGVPFVTATRLAAIHGREWVDRVTLNQPGGQRDWDTDGVIITGEFRPEASLIANSHMALDPATGGPEIDQFGRLSDPAYFAAGNLLRGVETAGWSWSEGKRAAHAIAAALSGTLPHRDGGLHLSLCSPALKFALPQVILPGVKGAPGAARCIQVRLARPARGRLCLQLGQETLASRRVSSRPERRITLPLPSLGSGFAPGPQIAGGRLSLTLKED